MAETTTRMIPTARRIQNRRGMRETTVAAEERLFAVRFADQLFTCPWRGPVKAAPRSAMMKTNMIAATISPGPSLPMPDSSRRRFEYCILRSPPDAQGAIETQRPLKVCPRTGRSPDHLDADELPAVIAEHDRVRGPLRHEPHGLPPRGPTRRSFRRTTVPHNRFTRPHHAGKMGGRWRPPCGVSARGRGRATEARRCLGSRCVGGRGSSGAWTGHAVPRIQTVQNEGAPPSEKNGPGGIRTLDSRIRNPEPYPC